MGMVLDNLIHRHARFRGDHPAVVFEQHRLNWREFDQQVNILSNALLRAGIQKGDRVATVLPNSLELLTLYWAVTNIGAVVVPTSPLLLPNGLLNLLRDSGSRLVFLKSAMYEGLQQLRDNSLDEMAFVLMDSDGDWGFTQFTDEASTAPPPRAELNGNDLFNIAYSSGTTGQPKGIMHSHDIRGQYGTHFATAFRMTPESVVLHTGSIVFNGAFVTLMPAFFLGSTYILHPLFDAEKAIETIRREKVTHVMMVPSQIIALLDSPNCTAENLKSLEMILTLGAPLPQSIKEQLNAVIPDRFYELYGLTEGFVTILDKHDFNAKPGSVGSAPPCFEIAIRDEEGQDLPAGEVGEIVGRGPILMTGYYGRSDLTEQAVRDGWMYSGDLGYLDEDGFLYLSGRMKEMIISGGVNVFPVDIETIIIQHPDVLEAAVFGAASEKWGETPVAAVVPKANAQIDKNTLIAWVNERVEAKFQRLADLILLDAFPRNVAGKILKKELKEIYDAN